MNDSVSSGPATGASAPVARAEPSLEDRRAAYAQGVAQLRSEVRRLWGRAGQPTPQAMARKVNAAPAVFETLLRDTATTLPSVHEMTAMLQALGEPQAQQGVWLRRVRHLEEQWKRISREQAQLAEKTSKMDQLVKEVAEQASGHEIVVDVPLTAALKAVDEAQYRAALGLLLSTAGLSYTQVAKKSAGRFSKSTAHRLVNSPGLPKDPSFVRAFVRACGASGAQADLWITILTGLRDRQPEGKLGSAKVPEGTVEYVDTPVVYLPFSSSRKKPADVEYRFRVSEDTQFAAVMTAAGTTLAAVAATFLFMVFSEKTEGKHEKLSASADSAAGVTTVLAGVSFFATLFNVVPFCRKEIEWLQHRARKLRKVRGTEAS